MMRFLAGFYLLIFGFVWVWQLKSGSPGAELFQSFQLAQIFGFASFFFGLFSISPKIWSWKDAEEGSPMVAINHLLRGSWYGVGGLMILLGLGLLGVAIFALSTIGAMAAALAVMTGLVYAVGGISLIRTPLVYQGNQQESKRKNDPTNLVLRIARAHRGRVTPTEIATESTLTVHDAQKILQRLASEGFCDERVSEAASSFYYFPEFAGDHAKRDIMEPDFTAFDHDVVFDHRSQDQASTSQHQHQHSQYKK